jgi:membrane fusion protein, multidrug efflux system
MTYKVKSMQRTLSIILAAALVVTLAACGSGAKDKKSELGDKKVKLEKLKKEQTALNQKVAALEKEIATLDPASATKPKLVTLSTIGTDTFSHYIDLQGKIDAQNVAMVAPQGQGGVVKAIYVKQGQAVRKGQLILKLDDAIARQGVAIAQQGISGAQAQYTLAQSVYERRKKLWEQNIGTEVQVLQAKADVDAALSQLKVAQAGVAQAQAQLNMSNVTSEISGTIDVVNVRVGEFFSPQSASSPQTGIRIVNASDLKVLVQVPENYLGKVKEGSVLEVILPETNNRAITTRVTVAGNLIDPGTRSFYVEGKIPASKDFRPNQIAMVKIKDYTMPNAITVPVNTVQNDEKGKYVMVAAKEGNKQIARKKQVTVGQLYGDKLEVKNGLKAGDVIITEGFQNLYDGQLITTEIK